MSERPRFPSVFDRSGRLFGPEELDLVRQVLESGTLAKNSDCGGMAAKLEEEFAARWGASHAVALNSGTAAMHCSLAAVGLHDGDEVVTSPLTDMGAVAPILFHRAVPIFADLDRRTLNLSKETVERKITNRTRAIVVTHLFGNPADVQPIVEVAHARGIAVIEDCAQAYLARWHDALVGSFGDFACFSLHQTKHITCGEGGLLLTNSEDFAARIRCFANKGFAEDASPRRYMSPGLSYHMNELSAAVALAQLRKLDAIVMRRRVAAQRLAETIGKIPALYLPEVESESTHSYWAFPVMLELELLQTTVTTFCDQLKKAGVPSMPSYIGQPLFEVPFLKPALRRDPALKRLPEEGEITPEKIHELFPSLMHTMPRLIVFPWNEQYEDVHVDAISEALNRAVDHALTDRALRLLPTAVRAKAELTASPQVGSPEELSDVADVIEMIRPHLGAS